MGSVPPVSIPLPWGPVLHIPASFWLFLDQVISAGILACLVWRLARNRIRTESWQERQDEAYFEATKALHTIREYTGLQMELEKAGLEGLPLPFAPDSLQPLETGYSQAHRKIRRLTAIGSSLIRPAAAETLRRYRRDLEEFEDGDDGGWTAMWTGRAALANQCWIELSELAAS